MEKDDSVHSAVNVTWVYAISWMQTIQLAINECIICNKFNELDPVGSTVRYEMMKLCTESVKDIMMR